MWRYDSSYNEFLNIAYDRAVSDLAGTPWDCHGALQCAVEIGWFYREVVVAIANEHRRVQGGER